MTKVRVSIKVILVMLRLRFRLRLGGGVVGSVRFRFMIRLSG